MMFGTLIESGALENNIAVPYSDATVTASDRNFTRTHGPENVLSDDSYWEAQSVDGEKWLEIDWRFPQLIQAMEATVMTPSICEQWQLESWDLSGKNWKRIASGSVTDKGCISVKFSPEETFKMRFVFTTSASSSGEGLRIANVKILSQEAAIPKPRWKSHWIWATSKDDISYPENVWLRRSFHVAEVSELRNALLQYGIDDVAKVYLNGRLIAQKTGVTPAVLDLKNYLVDGENVFAVHVSNLGGPCGFLAEICLNFRDGRPSEIITTDTSWKCVTREPDANWTSVKFDDAAWEPVAAPHGIPPSGVWGDVAYQNMVFNEDLFTIHEVQWRDAEVVKPGTWVRGVMKVSTQKALKNDYVFEVAMDTEYLKEHNIDLRVARSHITPEVSTSKWETEKTYEIPLRIWVDDFAPNGKINAYLKAVSETSNARLRFLEQEAMEMEIPSISVRRFDVSDVESEVLQPEIRMNGDIPTLFINGKPTPPVVMTQFNVGHRGMAAYTSAGIPIYRVAALGNVITTPELQKEVLENFLERLDKDVERLEKYDMQSAIILSVILRHTPEWAIAYPDELFLAGNDQRGVTHGMASLQWQQDAKNILKELVEYVESRPYGKRVIGYTILAGGGGEFHQYGPIMGMEDRDKAFVGDYSKPALTSFREWLKEQYANNVTELQKAWRDEAVTFENARPKNKRLVERAENGFFRDPATTRDISDYFKWYAHRNGQNLIAFCEAIKTASKRNPLCGGYYGYFIKMLTQKPASNHGEGHGAFEEVIDSEYVDFISLPYSYSNRTGGTAFAQSAPAQSLILRKKLFIGEYDNRTFLSGLRDYPQNSLAETNAIQRRDIGASLTSGVAWWWLDFSQGQKGQYSIPWFAHPDVIKDMKTSVELYRELQQKPVKRNAEIAVFLDMQSSLLLDTYASIPSYNLIKRTWLNEIPAIGAPVDYFSIGDIANPEVQQNYKMYIFLNPYELDEKQRTVIKEKLQKSGKTLVWFWGSGVANDKQQFGPEIMKEITGMDFAMSKDWHDSTIFPATELGLKAPLSMQDWDISYFRNRPYYEKRLSPVFWPVDKDVEVLGRFAFNKQPGISIREHSDWRSVYIGIPYAPSQLLRNLAHRAKVFVYFDETVASLDANEKVVSIHNVNDRITKGTLRLPSAKKIRNAFDGTWLSSVPVKEVEIELQPAETVVLILE